MIRTTLFVSSLLLLVAASLAQDESEKVYDRPCIFFGDRAQRKIYRVDLDGENRVDVVTEGVGAIHSLIVDQGDDPTSVPILYWTDTQSGEIKTARGDGTGRVSAITAGLLAPKNLYLRTVDDEKWLYFNEAQIDGLIRRVKIDGTDQQDLHNVDSPSGTSNIGDIPNGYYPSVMAVDEERGRIWYVTLGWMSNAALRWADLDDVNNDNECIFSLGRPINGRNTDPDYKPLRSPKAIMLQPGTDTIWFSDYNRMRSIDISNCDTGADPDEYPELPPMSTAINQVIHSLDDDNIHWMYYTEGLEVKEIRRQNLNDTTVPPESVAPTGLGSSPGGIGFGRYSSASSLVASFAVVLVCALVAVLGAL